VRPKRVFEESGIRRIYCDDGGFCMRAGERTLHEPVLRHYDTEITERIQSYEPLDRQVEGIRAMVKVWKVARYTVRMALQGKTELFVLFKARAQAEWSDFLSEYGTLSDRLMLAVGVAMKSWFDVCRHACWFVNVPYVPE
jgi:hypothetical protein